MYVFKRFMIIRVVRHIHSSLNIRQLILLTLMLFALISEETNAIQWLALNKPSNSSACHTGRNQKWLTKLQSYVCVELYPQLIDAVDLTISTCQDMFRRRRWNCTNINYAPDFTPDLLTGTREQAIVYAISSAALIYTFTRSCAQGNIYRCPCTSKPQPMVLSHQFTSKTTPTAGQFKWKGCNNNINWAAKISKNFLDSPYRKPIRNYKRNHETQPKGLFQDDFVLFINRHNNKIGRKNMEHSLSITCHCHGISGSCSMRTCWRGLPNYFSDENLINNFLSLYKSAVEIPSHGYSEIDFKRVRDKLIYLKKSPDYCTKDLRTGSQGTVDRYCNESLQSQNSCSSMCCGRGYRSRVIRQDERCHCKYYWCCYVKCKTCTTSVKINQCL